MTRIITLSLKVEAPDHLDDQRVAEIVDMMLNGVGYHDAVASLADPDLEDEGEDATDATALRVDTPEVMP